MNIFTDQTRNELVCHERIHPQTTTEKIKKRTTKTKCSVHKNNSTRLDRTLKRLQEKNFYFLRCRI